MLTLSCGPPEERAGDYGDEEIRQTVNQVTFLVDSLVRVQHPDPVAFLDSAGFASPEPDIFSFFREYISKGYYYHEHKKNLDLAAAYADSSLQLFEETRQNPAFNIYYLYAILNKGKILQDQYLYGSSIQYFLQGWQMIDPEQIPCMAAEFLGRMGSISYKQENYPGSIDFYTRSENIASRCRAHTAFNRFRKSFQLLQNMASNYKQLQMPDSALYYNNRSLEILENESEKFADNPNYRHFTELAKGVALGNKGEALLQSGRAEEAESLWKESIRINLKPGFANEHAHRMRLRLAGIYVDSGRLDDAEEQLGLVRAWLDAHPISDNTTELRWRKIRWKWLDRNGDTEQAYAAYLHYTELKDIVTAQKKEVAANDLAAQILQFEQQHQITALRTQAELRNVYLLAITLFSLMTVIILFLIWRNWKRSRQDLIRITHLNEAVSEQNHQLEQKNKTISKIMSTVAHDLRSPLYGVKELASLLTEGKNLTKKQKKWAQLIYTSNLHSMKLVKEILTVDFNRPETVLEKEPVDIKTFLRHCVDILQLQAKEKNQRIKLGLDIEEVAERVYLNPGEMSRVINNILSNAVKFSPEGATILVKLEKIQAENSLIRISVIDEGIGIPKHLEDVIFDVFTVARRRGTRNEESSGLGLSISKQIVEAHGGKIRFKSKEGAGTTFIIEIPAEQKRARLPYSKKELATK